MGIERYDEEVDEVERYGEVGDKFTPRDEEKDTDYAGGSLAITLSNNKISRSQQPKPNNQKGRKADDQPNQAIQ